MKAAFITGAFAIVAAVVGAAVSISAPSNGAAAPTTFAVSTTTIPPEPTESTQDVTSTSELAQEPSTEPGSQSGSSQEAALADSSQTFVADIDGFDVGNGASINGKIFADAFTYTYVDCDIWCGNASVDLNLARRYGVFTARVGVLDESKGTGNITVRLIADNKTLFAKAVSLGKSYDVRLSVRNVLRLRILATAPNGAPGGSVAIGDPTVST